MPSSVINSIHSAPTLIQIAQNDVWESTWDIQPNTTPSQDEIKTYLSRDPNATIAIELVFEQPEGIFIFGLDYNDHLLVRTRQEFISTILITAKNYHDFANLVHELDDKLIGSNFLFEGHPGLIRLGVVNHWFTVGPVQIWRAGGSADFTRENLTKLLASNPAVQTSPLNYQGLSFIFNPEGNSPGLRHWIKSPCSQKVGDTWVVNPDQILKYLHAWAGLTII